MVCNLSLENSKQPELLIVVISKFIGGNMREKIIIGKVSNTHGLRGDIKVYPYTDKENFEGYKSIMIAGVEGSHKISKVRFNKNMVILKLNDYNHIDEVEGLRNKELYVYRDELQPLADDEFYIIDVIGCSVMDESGACIGVVKDYLTHTSQAIFVVETKDGKVFMVPHVDAFVVSISIEEKRVEMKLIEGLME